MSDCYLTSNITGINYYTDIGRFTDKSNNVNERDNLFKIWWTDQIAQYGTKTTYYVKNYALSATDKFYGENTVDGFETGTDIVMVMTLNDSSIAFSQFGLTSNDEVEAYIDITTYNKTLSSFYDTEHGEVIEPKAGDVFKLTELGDDRPNGREGKYFEITERVDENISTINQLQGHYVFKIKAKRYDFSYTDNNVEEAVSDQVTNDTLSGNVTESEQSYIDDIDTAQASYFDYGTNDDVYGDYS